MFRKIYIQLIGITETRNGKLVALGWKQLLQDKLDNFEKIYPKRNNFTWHMIFLQGFIKFDQGISEKCVGQTLDGRKKEEE
jgi:hypothetical protein